MHSNYSAMIETKPQSIKHHQQNTKSDERNPQILEKKTAWHDQNHPLTANSFYLEHVPLVCQHWYRRMRKKR